MSDDPRRPLFDALDGLAEDDFRMGKGWERAHEIAQQYEGQPLFDQLHALCHRMEGDRSNAAYWYRRAGSEPFDGDFRAEADFIRREADRG
ncbi:hypothetical protein [Pararhizobium mangrovi]|uniref:Uncharacterized protein n=1 Tax=Pararhizobium mangrovi TaxID=2590452 RepID=A0A506U023_9HYPH|nr:hypothetical protein [Pararhizobium mangrovi]TPW27120.1 hypothetical protein FJU11_12300 [Pararhizobium mangrovi]